MTTSDLTTSDVRLGSRRSAGDILESGRTTVEPALRAAVERLPAAMWPILGYHYGWLDEAGQPTDGGAGKALRPTLALLAARAVATEGLATGAGEEGAAVPAAVAVELVHDFSLLHDDVMDRDLTRRHRPTTWSVFGVGPAILAGDALLVLAMEVLVEADHPQAERAVRMLSQAVQELVKGQVADLAFERRPDVGPAECLAMAEAKTGSLIGAAAAIGAVFGGGRPEQVDQLERFGRELGLAYQLVDDLLGIWGDPDATGKPGNNDLRNRKKSLPVVAALGSGTEAGQELARLYHREAALTEGELGRAAELVELAGGRIWCQDRAEQLLTRAESRLSTVAPESGPAADAVAELRTLARLLAHRDH